MESGKRNWQVLVRQVRTWSRSRAAILACVAVVVAGSVVSVAALGGDFVLDPEVRRLDQLVPETAVAYVEVPNAARTRRLWLDSAPGRRLGTLPAWDLLWTSRELPRLGDLLYILELKTGESPGELFEWLERPAAIAVFAEGQFLSVARLDVKSRFGVALIRAIKSRTIQLPHESPQAPSPDTAGGENTSNVVNREESPAVIQEKREKLRNLEISAIDAGKRTLYFAVLAEHLFIASDVDILTASLSLAGAPRGASLANVPGFAAARARLEQEDGQALCYIDPRWGLPGVVSGFLGGDRGLIAVLHAEASSPAGAQLFAAGKLTGPPAPARAGRWSGTLPREAPLVLYSEVDSLDAIGARLSALEGASGEAGRALMDVLDRATLERGGPASKGVGLVFHGFAWRQNEIVPMMSVGVSGPTEHAAKLGRAIFGQRSMQAQKFQNVTYMLSSGGRALTPAWSVTGPVATDGGPAFLSTHAESLQAVLATSLGTRVAVRDLPTFQTQGELAHAPFHIIVNLRTVGVALRDFLKAGALASGGEFGERTVDRDVLSIWKGLTEPEYGSLHISAGGASIYGRVVLGPATK